MLEHNMKASIKFGQRYACIEAKLNQRSSIQRENKDAQNDHSELYKENVKAMKFIEQRIAF